MDLPANTIANLFSLLSRTVTVIEKQTDLITNQINRMNQQLEDYIASQKIANEKINKAIQGVSADVTELKRQIEGLGQGTVTPEQSAALAELATTAGNIADTLAALDASTPPVEQPPSE